MFPADSACSNTMARKNHIPLSLTIGLLLSAIALYLTFSNIPLRELVAYLKTVNYWWIIPSMAIALLSFLVRVIRWQLLLQPVKKTPFWSAFHPLMIGFMANCLLPARVGELARPIIFYKRENVSFSMVLATVGAERVFDIVMLLSFLAVALINVDINPAIEIPFGNYQLNKATLSMIGSTTLRLCVILIAGIIFVMLRQGRTLIRRTVVKMPALLFFTTASFKKKLQQKLDLKSAVILNNFAKGFTLLKSPKKIGLCIALSFIVWALMAGSYYVMSFGCPGIDISFFEMWAVMVIICLFISLPSAPGFWGIWEAGGIFGLLIFGIPAKEAAGFTLANHVFQMVPVIVVGLLSAIITGINVMQIVYRTHVGS